MSKRFLDNFEEFRQDLHDKKWGLEGPRPLQYGCPIFIKFHPVNDFTEENGRTFYAETYMASPEKSFDQNLHKLARAEITVKTDKFLPHEMEELAELALEASVDPMNALAYHYQNVADELNDIVIEKENNFSGPEM